MGKEAKRKRRTQPYVVELIGDLKENGAFNVLHVSEYFTQFDDAEKFLRLYAQPGNHYRIVRIAKSVRVAEEIKRSLTITEVDSYDGQSHKPNESIESDSTESREAAEPDGAAGGDADNC